MDILQNIINLLEKEEIRNYKLITSRSHASVDRKDHKLFDYIRRSGEKYNERKIRKKLYENAQKNTFSRLKNRLLSDINKSQVHLHAESDEDMQIHQFLILSRLYKKKQQIEISYYYLRRAELKAKDLQKLEFLDQIYTEYIELSYDIVKINPETYIDKRKRNYELLNQLRKVDNILAVVNYRLQLSQNFSSQNQGIIDLLQKTLDEFADDPRILTNNKFRIQIYEAVSKILLQNQDFESLEDYAIATYEEFIRDQVFMKSNHDVKLRMLTYVINASFKNEKYDQSLAYIELLEKAMNEYNKLYYDRYVFFYYNTLAAVHFHSDLDKSLEILENMLDNPKISKVPMYLVYIYLNLFSFTYEKQDYRRSLQYLVKLKLQEAYKITDVSLKFKITMFEMIIRYDMGDMEVLDYRLNQCKKDFAHLINAPEYIQDRVLLEIITELSKYYGLGIPEDLKLKMQEFADNYVPGEPEIINYKEFITSTLNKT